MILHNPLVIFEFHGITFPNWLNSGSSENASEREDQCKLCDDRIPSFEISFLKVTESVKILFIADFFFFFSYTFLIRFFPICFFIWNWKNCHKLLSVLTFPTLRFKKFILYHGSFILHHKQYGAFFGAWVIYTENYRLNSVFSHFMVFLFSEWRLVLIIMFNHHNVRIWCF